MTTADAVAAVGLVHGQESRVFSNAIVRASDVDAATVAGRKVLPSCDATVVFEQLDETLLANRSHVTADTASKKQQ